MRHPNFLDTFPTSKTPKPNFTKESPYLATLINFYSTCYLIPFKAVRNELTGEYTLVSTFGRRLISGCFVGVAFLMIPIWYGAPLWRYLKTRHDVSTTFFVISQQGNLFADIIIAWQVWRRQNNIEKLTNLMAISVSPNRKFPKEQILTLLICIGFKGFTALQGFEADATKSQMLLMSTFCKAFFDPVFDFFQINPVPFIVQIFSEHFLGILGQFLFIWLLVIFNIHIWVMLVIVLAFRHVVLEETSKEDSLGNKLPSMIESYMKIKELSSVFKLVAGHHVLGYTISLMAFTAEVPHVLFTQVKFSNMLIMGGYMLVGLVTFAYAANIHTRAEEYFRKMILSQQLKCIKDTKEGLQLISICLDLDAKPLGVSCSFFTITTNFLTSMLGIMGTYSILIFQMSISDQEKVFWAAK